MASLLVQETIKIDYKALIIMYQRIIVILLVLLNQISTLAWAQGTRKVE